MNEEGQVDAKVEECACACARDMTSFACNIALVKMQNVSAFSFKLFPSACVHVRLFTCVCACGRMCLNLN